MLFCCMYIENEQEISLKKINVAREILSDKVPGTVPRSGACPLRMLATPSSILASGTFFRGDISLSSVDSRRTAVSYERRNVHSVLVDCLREDCTETVWLGYLPARHFPVVNWAVTKLQQKHTSYVLITWLPTNERYPNWRFFKEQIVSPPSFIFRQPSEKAVCQVQYDWRQADLFIILANGMA